MSTLLKLAVYRVSPKKSKLLKSPIVATTVSLGLTASSFFTTMPSGVMLGAGKVNQSTSSQKSFDQSVLQTLTLRSALAISHNLGELNDG